MRFDFAGRPTVHSVRAYQRTGAGGLEPASVTQARTVAGFGLGEREPSTGLPKTLDTGWGIRTCTTR